MGFGSLGPGAKGMPIGRPGLSVAVTGDKALDRKLADLGRRSTVNRVVGRGMSAGMVPVLKAIRAGINATDASPFLKREARKTIGKKIKRGGPSGPEAKAGFSVGKKAKQVAKAKVARSKRLGAGKGGGRGVGISASNIHWFVLGTQFRFHKKSGRRTGRIKPPFNKVMMQAVSASQGAYLAAARAKITQEIQKEAMKH